jgi:hypothetical protein
MRDDDAKDPIDALRYSLDPWIFRQGVARVGLDVVVE